MIPAVAKDTKRETDVCKSGNLAFDHRGRPVVRSVVHHEDLDRFASAREVRPNPFERRFDSLRLVVCRYDDREDRLRGALLQRLSPERGSSINESVRL
ncbi:MAG: hypothetical protein IPF53_09160 [Blastocatellia bacterium]|nr:hypothetical protein [Blastocatellia bacterium]